MSLSTLVILLSAFNGSVPVGKEQELLVLPDYPSDAGVEHLSVYSYPVVDLCVHFHSII